jgi:cytoskeleton protein RodZ
MSDTQIEAIESTQPQNTPEPTKPTLGQWLVAARTAKGLSAADVASQTNRNIRQIVAVESDDFSSVNTPALLRAVIRHYAKTIGADEAQALAHIPNLLQSQTPDQQAKEAKMGEVFSHAGTPMTAPWIAKKWLYLMLLVVLALIAYGVYFSRFMSDDAAKKKANQSNQVLVTPAQPTAPVEPPATVATQTAPATTEMAVATVDPNATAPTAVAPTATPAAGSETLTLKFAEKRWVTVRDANGVTLLTGLQEAGIEVPVTGPTPLSVRIGDISGVEATWKGQPLDLKSYAKGTGVTIKDLK